MQTISDNSLLDRLKDEDNTSFEILYKLYFPSIAAHIAKNYGNTEDAEDIFQESIIVLLQKVRQPDFILTSSLKTYLFAISKNLWMKRLRDNKLLPVASFEKYQQETETFFVETQPGKTKEEKLNSWLSKITDHCQKILKAIFFYNEPIDSLMKKLGWKNKHTAANQQYKCIQQVKKQKDKEPGA
ncbi:MAG: sigma-70 family RNA polymerase sigma factor [Chitinophagaceae bacterium]